MLNTFTHPQVSAFLNLHSEYTQIMVSAENHVVFFLTVSAYLSFHYSGLIFLSVYSCISLAYCGYIYDTERNYVKFRRCVYPNNLSVYSRTSWIKEIVHPFFLYFWKSVGTSSCLVTILQSIFFDVQQKKLKQVWNNRVNDDKFHFWVKYSFLRVQWW